MADSNLTKNALAEAMKSLMQEKKFEKISISDICEKCGMNRKSFYYHFRDKYDLVNWIFDVGFAENINVFDLDMDGEEDEDVSKLEKSLKIMDDLMTYFYRERDFYKAALQIEGQNSFRDYFHDMTVPVAEFFMSGLIGDDENGEKFVVALCDGFVDFLVRWLTSKEPEEPKNLKNSFRTMAVKLAYFISDNAERPEE